MPPIPTASWRSERPGTDRQRQAATGVFQDSLAAQRTRWSAPDRSRQYRACHRYQRHRGDLSDQGQIDNAKLQLVYSKILSPLSGRVGLRLIDPGNIVHATDTNGIVAI